MAAVTVSVALVVEVVVDMVMAAEEMAVEAMVAVRMAVGMAGSCERLAERQPSLQPSPTAPLGADHQPRGCGRGTRSGCPFGQCLLDSRHLRRGGGDMSSADCSTPGRDEISPVSLLAPPSFRSG